MAILPLPTLDALQDKERKTTPSFYRFLSSLEKETRLTNVSINSLKTDTATNTTNISSIQSTVNTLNTQKLTRSEIKSAGTPQDPVSNVLFTGIPSWVRKITVNLLNVSPVTTNNNIIVRIGPSNTPQNTGYVCTVGTSGVSSLGGYVGGATYADGFHITLQDSSGASLNGSCTFSSMDDSTWAFFGNIGGGGNQMFYSAGTKTIVGENVTLGCVQLIAAAGNLDSGFVNILYE